MVVDGRRQRLRRARLAQRAPVCRSISESGYA
jgi:hypothetical protein